MDRELNFSDLTFLTYGDLSEGVREHIKRSVLTLGKSKPWTWSPPEYLTGLEFVGDMKDMVTYCGGVLEVPGPQVHCSILTDDEFRRTVEDMRDVVGLVQDISKELDLNFEVYFEEEYIGDVMGGMIDDSIKKGLLDE